MSRYELIRRIGSGGMGNVFEARRTLPSGEERTVACKTMKRDIMSLSRYREFFFKEAAVNLDISHDHPNLVTVYDCIEDCAGNAHIIMELIEGCSLHDLLQLYREIELDILRVIASDVLDALDFIHGRGLVHRDISPCNVMINRQGLVKVSDFGLVIRVDDGPTSDRFRGKFEYGSPEAIRGEALDGRSDLFSFAAMMYEQIMKCSPYGEDGEHDIWTMRDRVKRWKPPRLPREVPEDLRTMITGLLQERPGKRRPQTARAARAMLDMSNAEAARAQLADMAEALYIRSQGRSNPGTEVHGGVFYARMADERDGVVDAHAVTEPEGIPEVIDVDTDTKAERPRGHTPLNRHVRAQRRRRHRQRLALAMVALLGSAIAGWYAFDREDVPEPLCPAPVPT